MIGLENTVPPTGYLRYEFAISFTVAITDSLAVYGYITCAGCRAGTKNASRVAASGRKRTFKTTGLAMLERPLAVKADTQDNRSIKTQSEWPLYP